MLEKERSKGNFWRNKNNCHAERFWLSISTLESSRDPEQQRLRMTALLNIGQVVPDNKINCHSKPGHYLVPHPVVLLYGVLESHRVWLRNNEILNQVQDDDYFKEEALNKGSFRAPLRSGFTLIELLVVVLIIGILAALALPQYQKAVTKSRFAAIRSLMIAIARAQETYFLANGEYASKFKDLDITADCTSTDYRNFVVCNQRFVITPDDPFWERKYVGAFVCPAALTTMSSTTVAKCVNSTKDYEYRVWLAHPDYQQCVGYTSAGKAFCKSLCGGIICDL